MKIRTNYVSNSSSSSFLAIELNEENIMNKIDFNKDKIDVIVCNNDSSNKSSNKSSNSIEDWKKKYLK